MQCPYVWDDPGDPLEPRFQVYKSGTCVPLYCRTYLHEYCCHLYTSLTMKERYSVNVPVESEDSFQLYDLRVEVVCPPGKRIMCGAKNGDFFTLQGEMLKLPPNQGISIYSLGNSTVCSCPTLSSFAERGVFGSLCGFSQVPSSRCSQRNSASHLLATGCPRMQRWRVQTRTAPAGCALFGRACGRLGMAT